MYLGHTLIAAHADLDQLWLRGQFGGENVVSYGAQGDGVADDTAAFTAAVAAAAVNGGTVVFPPGTYKITASKTVPANVVLDFSFGGLLNLGAGVVITNNGEIVAPTRRIFSGSGTITFTAQPGHAPVVYGEWWGAKPDGSTDCSPGLQAAITASGRGGVVQLLLGTYKLVSGLSISTELTFRGQSRQTTGLYYTGAGGTILTVTLGTSDVYIEDFSIDQIGSAQRGIYIRGANNFIKRIKIWPTVGFTIASIQTGTDAVGGQVIPVVLEDVYAIGTPRVAGASSAVGWLVPFGVTCIADRCFFENHVINVEAGGATNVVGNLVLRGCQLISSSTAGNGHRSVKIVNCQSFNVVDCFFELNGDANPAAAGQLAVEVLKCDSGRIVGCFLNGNGQLNYMVDPVGTTNVKNVSISQNKFYRAVDGIRRRDGAQVHVAADNIMTNTLLAPADVMRRGFTDADATPSVGMGNDFTTANTAPTTITALDDGSIWKTVVITIGDANTTFDFSGTTLKGNAGVDWVAKLGDSVTCTFDGTNWMCDVSDNVA